MQYCSSFGGSTINPYILDVDCINPYSLDVDCINPYILDVDCINPYILDVDCINPYILDVDCINPYILDVDCINPYILDVDCINPYILDVDCINPYILDVDCINPYILDVDCINPYILDVDCGLSLVKLPKHGARNETLSSVIPMTSPLHHHPTENTMIWHVPYKPPSVHIFLQDLDYSSSHETELIISRGLVRGDTDVASTH